MKKTLLVMGILAAVAIGAWFFVGQVSGSKRLASLVPQGSEMVLSINLPAMAKKADGEQLMNLAITKSLFANQHGELPSLLKQVAADPKSSGIRFTDNPHLFLSKTSSTGGLLLGIKNEEKFTLLVQNAITSQEIQTSGLIHYVQSMDGPIVLWNKETALIYMAKEGDDLLTQAQEILNKTAPGLDQLTLYKDSYIKGSDIFVYMKNSFLSSQPSEYLGLSFMKQSGEIAYGMSLKFKSGELEFESRTAFEKKEDAKFSKMYSNEAGQHFLAQSTSKPPLMAVQLQLNTSKLYDYLMDNPTSKASLDEMAEDLGVKTKELKSLFTGNIAFSMSGMATRTTTQNYFGIEEKNDVSIPEAALFIEIQDQELFQKGLDKGKQHPEDGKYTFSIPFVGEFYMVHTDAGVSILMDPEMASNLAKEKILSSDEFDEIGSFLKKQPNAAYVNLNLENYPVNLKEMIAKEMGPRYEMLETAFKPFSEMYAHQKKKQGFLQINMVNKEQNAFPQVIALLDRLYVMSEEAKVKSR